MSLFDVTIGSVALSTLSDKIYIRDIIEEPYEEEIFKASKAYYAGQRVSKKVRRALSVRVVFVVRERNPQKRAEIFDSIASWAESDRTLYVNYRTITRVTESGFTYTEGRRLSRVVVTEPPAINSANKWTKDVAITFTAFDVPYWEDESKYMYSFSANTLDIFSRYQYSGNIYNRGTAESPVTMRITNDSSSQLQSMNIRCGNSWFYFENLDIDPGAGLEIDYDSDSGILQILERRSDGLLGANKMPCRTAESQDDLMISPGSVSVQVSANVAVSGYFYCRGRYL